MCINKLKSKRSSTNNEAMAKESTNEKSNQNEEIKVV